jgi:ATP-dependent Clp protease protease subunit
VPSDAPKTPPEEPLNESVAERLFAARTVLLFGEVTMSLARRVSSQLLALASESRDPIRLVVHSPGGHVESADTVHDVIRFVDAPVYVLGTGWVASAGALIFVAAPKERRYCLENTRFLLHQPLGGVGGPATDVEIEARQIALMRQRLNHVFANATGQTVTRIEKDTDRNYWLTADEAREYGLVSTVISRASDFA